MILYKTVLNILLAIEDLRQRGRFWQSERASVFQHVLLSAYYPAFVRFLKIGLYIGFLNRFFLHFQYASHLLRHSNEIQTYENENFMLYGNLVR